jgi:hypothetical protein
MNIVLFGISRYIVSSFLCISTAAVDSVNAGPEETKNRAGSKSPPPDSDPFSNAELAKLTSGRQDNLPEAGPTVLVLISIQNDNLM